GRAWRTTGSARSRSRSCAPTGQGAPVGAVDRLLQARACREVPAAPRAVLERDQGGGSGQEGAGPGAGPEALGRDRRGRQDLLGDQGVGSAVPNPEGGAKAPPFVASEPDPPPV